MPRPHVPSGDGREGSCGEPARRRQFPMRQGYLVLAKNPGILLGLLRAADLLVILLVAIAAYEFRHDE